MDTAGARRIWRRCTTPSIGEVFEAGDEGPKTFNVKQAAQLFQDGLEPSTS